MSHFYSEGQTSFCHPNMLSNLRLQINNFPPLMLNNHTFFIPSTRFTKNIPFHINISFKYVTPEGLSRSLH